MTEVEYNICSDDTQKTVCKLNDYLKPADTIILQFTKLCLGDSSNPYSIKKILDVLEDRRFESFLSVIEDNNIQDEADFVEFISVIKEHCLDKGIHDYATVKKMWKEHKESIQKVLDNIKEGERKLKELKDAHI